jgi:hypothetical protein
MNLFKTNCLSERTSILLIVLADYVCYCHRGIVPVVLTPFIQYTNPSGVHYTTIRPGQLSVLQASLLESIACSCGDSDRVNGPQKLGLSLSYFPVIIWCVMGNPCSWDISVTQAVVHDDWECYQCSVDITLWHTMSSRPTCSVLDWHISPASYIPILQADQG